MADYQKMVLIENGKLGIVQNTQGDRVVFESLEDMTRVTGLDMTGKFYVGYEPEHNYFSDSRDPSISNEDIPYQIYENMIDNIAVLQNRKDNTLYGLSGQDLIDAQALLDAQNEYEQAAAVIKAEQEAAGVKQYTPDQVKAYIDNQVASAATNEEKFEVLVSIIKKLAVFVLEPAPPA